MRKFYKEDNESIPAIVYELTNPIGYTEITDNSELKILYIGLYKQREIDGINYFEDFRADLIMNIMDGTYTDLEVFALESHIKYLQDEIIIGNWLTSQNINSNLSLNGIYDQTMKDKIQNYINNYIATNY
jgi:hypothetical protein